MAAKQLSRKVGRAVLRHAICTQRQQEGRVRARGRQGFVGRLPSRRRSGLATLCITSGESGTDLGCEGCSAESWSWLRPMLAVKRQTVVVGNSHSGQATLPPDENSPELDARFAPRNRPEGRLSGRPVARTCLSGVAGKQATGKSPAPADMNVRPTPALQQTKRGILTDASW